MNNFVLKGHICYSDTPSKISINESSYVVCSQGKSLGVFKELPKGYKTFPIYDYGDRIIMPGLVDMHIHAPQYAYRGLGMDLELLDWLEQQAFPEEMKYVDLDYAVSAYSIFAERMKRSATSRACIFGTRHREATEQLMEMMEESGLVSYVGKVNMDRNSPEPLCEADAQTSAEETVHWLEDIKGRYERTKPILTPRFIPSCTDKLLDLIKEIQQKYNLPVQSHLSENPSEVRLVKELCPTSQFYGDAYDQHGLFGRNVKTIMAHCIYSSAEECKRLAENGVYVAHCPDSNMNLSSGIAPIRKYLDAGIRVGLGSDVAGGQTESIFRAMIEAIQVSKLYWRMVDNLCAPITFDETFYMATKGGGEFFGKVGGFEEGYEFDAIVIDDANIPYPQKLSVRQRLERDVYLSVDINGICAKYVAGRKIF